MAVVGLELSGFRETPTAGCAGGYSSGLYGRLSGDVAGSREGR